MAISDTSSDDIHPAVIARLERVLYLATGHAAHAQLVYADLVEAFDSLPPSSWPAHLLKVDQAGAVLLRAHEIIQLYEERIAAASSLSERTKRWVA